MLKGLLNFNSSVNIWTYLSQNQLDIVIVRLYEPEIIEGYFYSFTVMCCGFIWVVTLGWYEIQSHSNFVCYLLGFHKALYYGQSVFTAYSNFMHSGKNWSQQLYRNLHFDSQVMTWRLASSQSQVDVAVHNVRLVISPCQWYLTHFYWPLPLWCSLSTYIFTNIYYGRDVYAKW